MIVGAQGRCAGDGETGDLKAIAWHVTTCRAWAALPSEKQLPPAEEYARWKAGEAAAEHAADLARRVSDTVSARQRSVARFKVPDPLED